MNNEITAKNDLVRTPEAEKCSCSAVGNPKSAIVVNDRLFPMSRLRLAARDILDQAGVTGDFVLVRDYETRNDMAFQDDAIVDLSEGNVFTTVKRCDLGPQIPCQGEPKLAFVCDDVWAVTLIPLQTGRSLKRLLELPEGVLLLRDYTTPQDEPISDGDKIAYEQGWVFTAKRAEKYCIDIEGKKYPWSHPKIGTADIRRLGGLPNDQQVVCEDEEGNERTLREDEVVELELCCRFGRAPKYKRG